MKTLILSGFGTNCEKETLYACRRAGGENIDLRHINVIYHEGLELAQYHLLILIGGFLDGDDLGAARACANRFRFRALPHGGTFLQDLQKFVAQGRLVLGICNGFQLLVKLGLLPGTEAGARQQLTMAPNANHRFEDRWVDMIAEDRSPCVFTRGIGRIELPVRHGEGRVWAENREVLERLAEQGLAPLIYCSEDGAPTEAYPANPNGSPLGIAALCNPTGTVMGLMPHPEAYNHYTNHPQWSRRPYQGEDGKGLAILRNAYRYLAHSGD